MYHVLQTACKASNTQHSCTSEELCGLLLPWAKTKSTTSCPSFQDILPNLTANRPQPLQVAWGTGSSTAHVILMPVPKYTVTALTKGTEQPQLPAGSHWEPQLPRTPERWLSPLGDPSSCHQPQQTHLRAAATQGDTHKATGTTCLIPGCCQGFGWWPVGKYSSDCELLALWPRTPEISWGALEEPLQQAREGILPLCPAL